MWQDDLSFFAFLTPPYPLQLEEEKRIESYHLTDHADPYQKTQQQIENLWRR